MTKEIELLTWLARDGWRWKAGPIVGGETDWKIQSTECYKTADLAEKDAELYICNNWAIEKEVS